MEVPKIVQELLDKKAEMSNTVDLDAYANGLLDMYQALQLQQTDVVGRSEQLPCDECVDGQRWSPYYAKYVECDCRK